MRTATGRHLSVPPAAREALRELGLRSPGFHPGEQKKKAVVRGQAAVVGIHIRIDGWGLTTWGLPPLPLAPGGNPGNDSGWAVAFQGEERGKDLGEKAPAPRDLGPLLPSRTPNTRNTGCAASGGLYARPCRARTRYRWRRSGGAPGTLAELGFGSPETLAEVEMSVSQVC